MSTKASSKSSSGRASSKAISRSSKEKRALDEKIKLAKLIGEAEYMKEKQSLELENLRIQLAAKASKSKTWVKMLEAPSDEQVTEI